MTQKSIKIKITVGNGTIAEKSEEVFAKSASEDVVIRPNYRGIFVLLVASTILFGGGWLIFSSDEPPIDEIATVAAPPNVPLQKAALSPIATADVRQPVVKASEEVDDLAILDNHEFSPSPSHQEQILVQTDKKAEAVLVSESVSPLALSDSDIKQTSESENRAAVQNQQPVAMTKNEVKIEPEPNLTLSEGHVARAQFTNGISKREPVDKLRRLHISGQEFDSVKLFFFSELRNLKGETITHHWLYQGEEVAKVKFRVGGDSWRVYSSKNIQTFKDGVWSVIVNDGQGNELYQGSLVAE